MSRPACAEPRSDLLSRLRTERIRDVTIVMAGMLGPALEFDDAESGKQSLRVLAEVPGMRAATVLRANGSDLASEHGSAQWGPAPRCPRPERSERSELDAPVRIDVRGDVVCASAPIRGAQGFLGRLLVDAEPPR